MNPMFRNISQAVHFSYVMQAYSATPMSQMAVMVERARKETGIEDCQRSRIDTDGMNAQEIHIECSRIRDKVRAYLCTINWLAMEARFQTNPTQRQAAIINLAQALRKTIDADELLLLELMTRHYLPEEQRKGFSLRDIAKRFGISKDRTLRITKALEQQINLHEQQAFEALRRNFEDVGLVDRRAFVREEQSV
jgi:hypothetical protein